MYYDFHSHILPEMDDGADSSETSAKMLKALKSQGVEHVVLTPHFYPDEESADEFYERRHESLEKLLEVYDKASMPSFSIGAEVAVRPGVSRQDLQRVSLGTFIMLELPPDFGDWILDETEKILLKGFKPIFAHIERSMINYRDYDFEKVIDYRSFIYQLNVAALKSRRMRRFFLKEFKKGGIFILGSDCHNMTGRPPDFNSKALGARGVEGEFIDAVTYNSKYILDKVGETDGNEQCI